MSIIKLTDAFKEAANWISATVRAFHAEQSPRFLDTVADVNDNDLETANWIYVKSKTAVYRYTPASVASDDGDTVLQDNIGRRYVKVADTAIAAWADAHVADITARGAHDAAAEGFVVLVDDTGAGRSAFYTMGDGGSADWQGPAFLTGAAGANGTNGAPGSSDVVGTSTTSLAIAAGAKNFTIVEDDRGWGVGARLRASSDADGANFMEGVVTAYSVNTLQISVDLVGGSGTLADWTINLAGAPGAGSVSSVNGLTGAVVLDVGAAFEDYSAVGDGSTDDLAALQAAIDAVALAGGGIVEARGAAKTYKISGDLTVKDGVIVDLRGSTILVTNTTDSIIGQSTAKLINGTLSAEGVTSYVGPLWLTDDNGGYVRTNAEFHGTENVRFVGPGAGASAAGTAILLHGNGGAGISRTWHKGFRISNFATGIRLFGEASWVNDNVFTGQIYGCVNFIQIDGNANAFAVDGNRFDVGLQPNTSTTIADRAIDCIDGSWNQFAGFIWDWSSSGSATAVEFGANAARNEIRDIFIDETYVTDSGIGNGVRFYVDSGGDTYIRGSRASGDLLIFDAPNANGGIYFRRNGENICSFTSAKRLFFTGEAGGGNDCTIKNSRTGAKTVDLLAASGDIAIIGEATAANIAAVGNAINTSGKAARKIVWDTTNNRLMVAAGAAAADAWYVADGSASVTPA